MVTIVIMFGMVTMVTMATHNTNVSERSCEGCFYFKGCGYCVVVLLCLCGTSAGFRCLAQVLSDRMLILSPATITMSGLFVSKKFDFSKIPWHSHSDKICFVALSTNMIPEKYFSRN